MLKIGDHRTYHAGEYRNTFSLYSHLPNRLWVCDDCHALIPDEHLWKHTVWHGDQARFVYATEKAFRVLFREDN